MGAWTDYLISDAPQSRRQAQLGQFWRQWLALKRNPLAVVGLSIVVALLLVAAFAPLIATHDPLAQNLDRRLLPPSATAWFGTDSLGRDIYSRIVYGTRVTLVIVMLVVLSVLTGIVYPLVVTGLAQVAFPWRANGSLAKTYTGHTGGTTQLELVGTLLYSSGDSVARRWSTTATTCGRSSSTACRARSTPSMVRRPCW
jgi:hypothetical protein